MNYQWIDTHAHLFHKDFQTDLTEVLQRSQAAGVTQVYLPNLNAESLLSMEQVAKSKEISCHPCIGLHPCYVEANYEDELLRLDQALKQRKYTAIGETGLDNYHSRAYIKEQEDSFLRHIDWAIQYKRPLILHGRGTTARLLELLRNDPPPRGGVFHCFSGTYKEATQALDLGFYIGVGGVVTYKNGASLREIIKKVPLEHIVLETDAPYLAPTGASSRRNEPANIPLIGKAVAKSLGCPEEQVALITSANALQLFKYF